MAISPLILASTLSAVRTPHAGMRTFGLGFLTGAVYFGGTVYWVAGVMQTYGGLSMIVAVLVALLLVAYLAIYTAGFAWLVHEAVRRFGPNGVWFSPLFWVAAEWLRGTIGGGFPWVLLGSSQATVLPVVQAASVVGVFGLSALVAAVGTAAAALAIRRDRTSRAGAGAVGVLLVAVTAGGMVRVRAGDLTASGAPIRVGLVQGSIDQNQKYDARLRDAILQRYTNLSRQTLGDGAKLVLWPEASTPFYFDSNSALAEPVRRLAIETKTPFIVGTDELARGPDGMDQYFNSAVLVGADGRSRGSYRKMHLVPFGEYVPMKSMLFFAKPLIEAVSDFSAGVEPVVFDADGRRVSVAICYESIYPGISRAFVARGSELLATITNDAWFGRSSAAYQHFEQGALRAVEEGRYVVRAANTGISGAVDPYGRILARTDLFVPTALTVDVRLISSRTVYSYVGDVVAWVALAGTVLVLATRRKH